MLDPIVVLVDNFVRRQQAQDVGVGFPHEEDAMRGTSKRIDPKTTDCTVCAQKVGAPCVSIASRGKQRPLARSHTGRYAAARIVAAEAMPKKPKTKPKAKVARKKSRGKMEVEGPTNVGEVIELGKSCGGFSPIPLVIDHRVVDVPVDQVYEVALAAAPTLLSPPSTIEEVSAEHERSFKARHRAGDRSARKDYLKLAMARIAEYAQGVIRQGDSPADMQAEAVDEACAVATAAFVWWQPTSVGGSLLEFILREIGRVLAARLRHRTETKTLLWSKSKADNVSDVVRMTDEVLLGGKRRGFSLHPLLFKGKVVEDDPVRAGAMARHLNATIGGLSPRTHQEITLEHEHSYISRFRLGDVGAAWEYIDLNEALVKKLVKKARRFLPKNDLPREDLEAEGRLGAFEAFRRWDPSAGKFSTYAYAWILSHLQGRAAKGGSAIGVRQEVHLGLSRGKKEGRKLTESEAALERALKVASIDEKVGGEDGRERAAVAALPSDSDVEGEVVSMDFQLRIRACVFDALDKLSERERDIVMRRMYSGEEPITLDEIGRELKISRERVRQIETAAHRKLRETISTQFGGKSNVLMGFT